MFLSLFMMNSIGGQQQQRNGKTHTHTPCVMSLNLLTSSCLIYNIRINILFELFFVENFLIGFATKMRSWKRSVRCKRKYVYFVKFDQSKQKYHTALENVGKNSNTAFIQITRIKWWFDFMDVRRCMYILSHLADINQHMKTAKKSSYSIYKKARCLRIKLKWKFDNKIKLSIGKFSKLKTQFCGIFYETTDDNNNISSSNRNRVKELT